MNHPILQNLPFHLLQQQESPVNSVIGCSLDHGGRIALRNRVGEGEVGSTKKSFLIEVVTVSVSHSVAMRKES